MKTSLRVRPHDPYAYDPAYRRRDAAKYCGISVNTLLRRVAEGRIARECILRSKDGRHDRYVFRRSELNRFLASEGREPAEPAK